MIVFGILSYLIVGFVVSSIVCRIWGVQIIELESEDDKGIFFMAIIIFWPPVLSIIIIISLLVGAVSLGTKLYNLIGGK